MGKVEVAAIIENLPDLYDVEKGRLTADQVRRIDVTEALISTGISALSLPRRLIVQLGLKPIRERRARMNARTTMVQMWGAVKLTIQDRDCIADVAELPDDSSMLIGQLTLRTLDLVVDPVNQRLIGNPAHGAEHIIELYHTLDERDTDYAAIQAGIEDMEAGRLRPLLEVAHEIAKKHSF